MITMVAAVILRVMFVKWFHGVVLHSGYWS